MLQKIEIQNYAIIEQLEIKFPAGLTIITGETGAGKSILLGALGLIMGKRADSKVLYDPDKKCFVEATFDISAYDLKDFFESENMDYYDELIIRREIVPGGKSRAFVNDSPITLDVLQSLTENLLDVHQQFDILDIQKTAFQLQMVDALAGNKILLEKYSESYRSYKNATKTLQALKEKNKNASQEIEFLRFQKEEFDKATLTEGEEEDLEQNLAILTAAEEIKRSTSLIAYSIAEDENALLGQVQLLANQLSGIKTLDTSYKELYNRLIAIREEMMDVAKEAGQISENTEFDPEAIHVMTARLNLINRLEKKHHVTQLKDLLVVEADIRQRLNSFTNLDDEITALEQACIKMETDLKLQAKTLSENRKKITASFEGDVHDLLVSLSMHHAYIKVNMETSDELLPTGVDVLNILFAPNKGSAFLPLKDTASGGEIARLTLCIKSLVAGAITLPTLIFDEIDAGVSGDVAQKMGVILSTLSKNHQVICITHSPQIAAKAESHFWVYKTDKEARTVTSMRILSMEERILELAKMLSGDPPTEAAKANAKELLHV